MTFYSVAWVRDAENELANIYLQATDKQAVTQAQAVIDTQLRTAPIGNETPLYEGLWKLAVPPLVAFYSIDAHQQSVEVSWVARTL